MNAPTRWTLLASLALLAAPPALAQRDDDQPIAYPDQEEEQDRDRRELPRRSDPSARVSEETEVEREDREETLAHLDDPNIGLSGELVAGLMFIEAARGGFPDARFIGGLRFTWEWGRLIPDEFAREMFFADVLYAHTQVNEGTAMVKVNTNYHYVAVAPAFCYPLGGPKSVFAPYVQVGIGFAVEPVNVILNQAKTELSGTKFLLQYGAGLRFRPALSESGSVRLSFRFEFTRFLRGYMHDNIVGGSMGLTF